MEKVEDYTAGGGKEPSKDQELRQVFHKEVKPYYRGTLIVRTQGQAMTNNADQVKNAADGYTEYVWHMTYPPKAPHLVFGVDAKSAQPE